MIAWFFVAVLVMGIILLSRNSYSGLGLISTMIGGVAVLIIFLLYAIEVSDANRPKCSAESMESRADMVAEMKSEVFNKRNISGVRTWLDTIDELESKNLNCYISASRAEVWGEYISLNGLIPIYSDDTIPEHLKTE